MKRIYAVFMVWCLLLPLLLPAQSLVIRGKVTDAGSGNAFPGVTIQVKSSVKGTTTGPQGEYNITVPDNNAVLIFRAVGYLSQELAVGTQTTLNVALQVDTRNLEQVVVTALGITRKERAVGYATQQVKGENLTVAKEQNVLAALSGKIAGVQVTGSSGASMGGTQKIKIRGVNSLNGQEQPLIVVDGTPVSNNNFADRSGRDYGNMAQDINPDDIESVSVLKGPAASALYGLRGQFGVVLITTKKGARKGDQKVAVDFSSAFSIEKAGNFLPLQNVYGGGSSQTFPTIDVNGTRQPFVGGTDESWGPKMDGTPVRHMYSWYPADPDYGKLTPFSPHPNNVKDYFGTGQTFNNGISMSGGGENTTFRLSFNHTDIKGIEPNTKLKRNNVGFNGSLNITPRLMVSTSINYANNKGQRPSQGYYEGSRNFYQWFQRSLDMKKLAQYKYSDGRFYQWNLNDPTDPDFLESGPIDWNNPYFEAYENPSHDSRDRYFGNVGLTYDVMDGLKLSGFIRSDMYVQNIDRRNAQGGRFLNSYYKGKFEGKEMNYEFLAQYNKSFGDFSLNANLGANLLTQRFSIIAGETVGGLSVPNFFNLKASNERPTIIDSLRRKEIRSFYGTVTLGYRDIYYLDATLRNDISSALPENNNSYWYPSVSASIVFSELLKWEPLSFGKVRVSWAQAGSDLDAYLVTPSFGLVDPYDGNSSLFIPNTLNNPLLVPAIGTSFETGLDLKFLDNRLGLNFTYYNQQNRKQVLNIDVSGTSGYNTAVINAGNIQNKGFEISLNAEPVRSRQFNWNTTFNIARNTSQIKELYPNIDNLIMDQNTYSRVTVYLNAQLNAAFGTLIGNAYQRDPKTGKVLLDDENLPMYEQNHDFGSVLPDFTGGWQNSFQFGDFNLGCMIDFQSGGQFFSWTKMLAVKSGQDAITAAMNDRGKNVRDPVEDGGGVKVNGVSASTGQEVTTYVDAKSYFRTRLGTQVYEEWLYDATYIKMREIRAGYTFTRAKYKKLPFNSLNLSFITRNPFMIYQKAPKGLDPSELSTGSSAISWLETGQLASTRSFGINLNVSF